MEDFYKLIEDYLNNRLPEDRRREIEQRMAEDETFRREVHLHRAMQGEFSDARGWNLYASLQDIMNEDEAQGQVDSPDSILKKRSKWLWLILTVLIGGMTVWYFSNSKEPAPTPHSRQLPTNDTKDSSSKSNDSLPVKLEDMDDIGNDSIPIKPQKEKLQMAIADPKNFEPNQTMEAYIRSGGTLGIGGVSVRINALQQVATFLPSKKGFTRIHFSGAFLGLHSGEKTGFVFNIFDNKNTLDPRAIISMEASADGSGTSNFKVEKTLKLNLGLYYYQIEHVGSGEVLVTGKFFIGSMK